jgi:hypothetical protein
LALPLCFFLGALGFGGAFFVVSIRRAVSRARRSISSWECSSAMSDLPTKATRPTLFLPPPYLEALGNIAVHWVWLESATEIVIWAFLKLDYFSGSAVTTHMGAVARIHLLKILATRDLSHVPVAQKKFLKILEMMEEARISRNNVIHALWKYEPNRKAKNIHMLKRSAKGVLRTDSKSVTLSVLRALAIDIHWLCCGLQGFVEAVFPGSYMPWPQIPQPPTSQKKG